MTKLRPQAEADKALKDHLETNHIWDDEKNEMWEPKIPPPDPTPDDDEDEPGPVRATTAPEVHDDEQQ